MGLRVTDRPDPFSIALERREAQGLLRSPVVLDGAPSHVVERDGIRCLNLASNNSLDLAGHPRLRMRAAEALERAGTGSGGSRLLGGNLRLHEELEDALERYRPGKALLFNTGFQANHTLISSLGEAAGGVFADRLVHASAADGLRALRAPFHRFRHNDCDHLEELLKRHQPREGGLVVTETLFSMEGDFAPLVGLCALQRRYGFWLLLDEAHSTGAYGDLHLEGLAGIPERTVWMGTFGKALGSFGAYVSAPRGIRDYLVQFGRGFLFSTSLPPAVLGANLGALEVVSSPEEAWRREKLAAVSSFARKALRERGFDTGPDSGRPGHILPVRLGTPERALRVSGALLRAGFHAPAIRPPTVPQGTARLRLGLTCAFAFEEVTRLADALERAA